MISFKAAKVLHKTNSGSIVKKVESLMERESIKHNTSIDYPRLVFCVSIDDYDRAKEILKLYHVK